MGSFGQVEHTRVEDLMFRIYTDEEIKRISVVKVTNDESFNELGHVIPDGLYDLRMGPLPGREQNVCQSCGQNGVRCHGHCGHIELPLPVYNPFFYEVLRQLLRAMCPSCYRFQAAGHQMLQLKYQLQLLEAGYGHEALELQDLVARFVSGNEEAVEIITGVDDRIIKGTEKDYGKLRKLPTLEKAVKDFCEHVIKGGTCTPESSTSIIRGLEVKVVRAFLKDCSAPRRCMFCSQPIMKLSLQNSRFLKASTVSKSRKKKTKVTKENEEEDEKQEEVADSLVLDAQSYITSEQARNMLRRCWEKDGDLLGCLYPVLAASNRPHPTDSFFLSTLLVVAPKFRPCNIQDGMTMEHEHSVILKNVVRVSKVLSFLLSLVTESVQELPEALKYMVTEVVGKTPVEKIQTVWYQLQGYVDNLYDAELNRLIKVTTKGMRQIIEKKEGLFRHNLMGKRVNFSARSVAAPDPMLAVDEVGVPMHFAMHLYYPVPVTQWNVEQLRQLVINGPEVYPGAVMVEDEEGRKKHLSPKDREQREALAKKLLTPPESHVRIINANKVVYRHLRNGDFVLMNRQPTLHRPSIQAHRARVMPNDRVFRMPYANCKAYNADFDGDELNMHFPQNELARSEAQQLVTTHAQYLTPKDGSPLAGLIQDCVVASVMLTVRGKFFSRQDYQQLVCTGLADHTNRIKVLPPALLKPQRLWSGKQVISTLLLNLIPEQMALPSFSFKTSVKVDLWQTEEGREWRGGGTPEKRREAMTDSDFVMRDGELLSGVIDKSAIGSTSYGLVHVCYELYGGAVASRLLTAVNRLCVHYLKWCGHTISVKEFITPSSVSNWRREALAGLTKRAAGDVSNKLDIAEESFRDHYERSHMSRNEKAMAAIDAAYTAALGPTTSSVTGENEKGLLRRGLDNHMRMMVDTGAKGSKVNMNQMVSLFGSVAIDGKRMPLSITGKSLPSFKCYDINPRAGGYIPNRFMTGIHPQSYFFLCIVGRDSLQHTAVKTADSGYLQRCLIKHLEGIQVKYDKTVRNSDGLVLQFEYGEDGLDVTKVPFLKDLAALDVLVQNKSRLLDPRALTLAQSLGQKDLVDRYAKKLRKWHKKVSKPGSSRRSGFLKFCRKVGEQEKHIPGYDTTTGRSNDALHLQESWHNLTPPQKDKYNKKAGRPIDPINSVFSGATNLGVVSEALDALVTHYYDKIHLPHTPTTHRLSRQQVATTVHMKALDSMVNPGEAVGALCAQALGEPLTQMTLNTFHFAGRDELNVTLGVPRMAEVLKTASKVISTPIMEVPFQPHVNRARAEALRIKLSEVSLAKVLEKMTVNSELERGGLGKLHRRITLRLSFLPHGEYRHICAVTPTQVLKYVERYFIPKVLMKDIHKSFNKKYKICSSTNEEKKKTNERAREEEEEAYLLTEEESHQTQTNVKSTFGVSDGEDEDEKEEKEEEAIAGDGSAELSSRSRKRREQDYSENEEEAEQSEDERDQLKKSETVVQDEGFEEEEVVEEEEEEEEKVASSDLHQSTRRRKGPVSCDELNYRREQLMSLDPWIVDYKFDQEKELWCEVSLVLPVRGGNYDLLSIMRQKSEKALIHHVKGIGRVFVVEKDNRLMLRTEGVNIMKMFEFEHMLDINCLYTNNIYQISQLYGIEAAQRSIIKELRAVQSAYDIKVDFRHLTLLADYFTCEGEYKACSRQAMVSCVSPLQKMTFETSTNFLRNAVLRGEKDRMESPSANIALGQPIKLGTNAMQLLQVVKMDASN